MRAFITGGAGFAGAYLAELLASQGEEVTVLALHQEKPTYWSQAASAVRMVCGDVRDAERLDRIVRELRPDRIYHLAALSSPLESLHNPLLTYAVNLGGTLNLLEACRKTNLDCRVLIVSSSEVYGQPPPDALPLREDAPLLPENPYAGSKAAAEMAALQYSKSYGLRVIRVRPFNHMGPRQSPAFVGSDLARQAAEIELGLRPPEITAGNLQVRRDFSDVRDIVRGYQMLMERGAPGEVYQLCSGRAVSIEEIAGDLARLGPCPIRVSVDPAKARSRDNPLILGDFSKTRQAVGWEPNYALKATLRDLKQYWIATISSGVARRPNLVP